MKRLLLLLASLLPMTSCRTTRPCDFSLSLDGWRPIKEVPAALAEISDHSGTWYINQNRQYLACFNPRGDDLCGGIYEVYVEKGGLFSQVETIVCT